MTYLETLFWKVAIWIIERGYGTACPEFSEGCGACQANKAANWIRGHIDLINWK